MIRGVVMKKIFSGFIAVLLCLCLMPISAIASEVQTCNINKTIGLKEKVNINCFIPEAKQENYTFKYSGNNKNIVTVTDNIICGVGTGTTVLTVKCYETILVEDKVESEDIEDIENTDTDEIKESEDNNINETEDSPQISTHEETVFRKEYKIKITVKQAPKSVTLNKTGVTLGAGEKFKLTATIKDGYSYKKQYCSINSKIARIDQNGNITAVAPGSTKITFLTFNKIVTCNVTVKQAPSKITITNKNNNVQKGTSSHKIKYSLPSGSYSNVVTYSVKDKSIAKVSSSGYVTGLKKGKTTLTVKTYNGKTANCTIQVTDDALSLNIQSAQIAYDYDNVKRIKYGTSVKGKPLEAYEIYNASKNNKYTKTIFINFAVHGFEDEYNRDAKVLVKEGNALIKYFANHSSELNNYRLVIVPCANPDGTIGGTNNYRSGSKAFGRCTYKHIDMNRDFISFKAQESRALRDIIKKEKTKIYLDCHGWENQVLGTTKLNSIIKSKLGVKRVQNGVYCQSKGYIIGWVNKTLKVPAAIIEYKNSKSVNTTKDVNMIKEIIKQYK